MLEENRSSRHDEAHIVVQMNNVRISLTLILLIFLAASSWAGYEIRLNDGVTLTWEEFTEENGQYCTVQEGGKICLAKRDVVSLKKTKSGASSDMLREKPSVSPAGNSVMPEKAGELVTPRHELPTMAFSEFLSGYEDQQRRAWLWDLFRAAERQAKTFAPSSDRWIVLRQVVAKPNRAMWIEDGTIEIDPAFDPGTLFHEIFHTVFHKSPLRAGKDEPWGEAFSDAFRYMMEKQFVDRENSGWSLKIDRFLSMSYDAVMVSSGDPGHDRKYGYPAALIVRAASKDLKEFRKLWFTLLQQREQVGSDVLNDYFKYDMQNGCPL